MKRLFKQLSIMFLFTGLIFGLFACTSTPKDPDDNGNDEAHELAGEYEIDIANFGMPLVFFLRINDDGTFILAPNRNFAEAESRGSGQLAESGGTYMLIYADHSPENPKTAVFLVENHNLVFETTLPYGGSNIMQSAEDPDDPEIIHILTAHTLQSNHLYGLYAGSHIVSAMGSVVEYNYTMTLISGLRYVFHSQFTMGDVDYEHYEYGHWNVEEGAFNLIPEGEEPVVGTIEEGVISTSIKASFMAQSRTETTLTLATHSAYAGIYLGHKTTPMYVADVSLELSIIGTYIYTASFGMAEPYVETGTYDVDGNVLTLTPDEGDPYTVVRSNVMFIEGDFLLTSGMPATSFTLYNEYVNGVYVGSATHDDVEYTTELTLNLDGTFSLTITDDAAEVVVHESGDFTVAHGMMGYTISLVGVVPVPSIMVGINQLNFTLLLPGMDSGNGMGGGLGFSLTK